MRVFQQVLRHLCGLPAARLALDDGDGVIVEGVHERGAMAKHREGTGERRREAPRRGRGGAKSDARVLWPPWSRVTSSAFLSR